MSELSDDKAIEHFKQRAEEHEMNPQDVEILDEPETLEDEGRRVEGKVESKLQGTSDLVELSIPLRERGPNDESPKKRIQFLVDWYAGETEHQLDRMKEES